MYLNASMHRYHTARYWEPKFGDVCSLNEQLLELQRACAPGMHPSRFNKGSQAAFAIWLDISDQSDGRVLSVELLAVFEWWGSRGERMDECRLHRIEFLAHKRASVTHE